VVSEFIFAFLNLPLYLFLVSKNDLIAVQSQASNLPRRDAVDFNLVEQEVMVSVFNEQDSSAFADVADRVEFVASLEVEKMEVSI
jgi:hypothetical protein